MSLPVNSVHETNSLPSSLQRLGRSNVRLAVSSGLALSAAMFVGLMVFLVETHVPDDSLAVASHFPAAKVIFTLGAASGCAMLAWLLAMPALLVRRWLPLLWLVPMLIGGLWFAEWYDWKGLYQHGKAWAVTPSGALRTSSRNGVNMTAQTIEQLQAKKCVPCEGGVPKLTPDEVDAQLSKLQGWTLAHPGERIRKEWTFKNFVAGLRFLNAVGEVAEAEGHHPDLHLVGYRNVAIEIYTHAIGGLSENDFILAAKIDQIQTESPKAR